LGCNAIYAVTHFEKIKDVLEKTFPARGPEEALEAIVKKQKDYCLDALQVFIRIHLHHASLISELSTLPVSYVFIVIAVKVMFIIAIF